MNLCKSLRVPGSGFQLKNHAPDFTGKIVREAAENRQQELAKELQELEAKFYADDRNALLIVLQGMDAAGKDGIIKHVLTGINPAGCVVHSFKTPSAMDLEHDYLWRCHDRLPERGHFGIFNRSYYEEVLIVRVHPEFLDAQKLPEQYSKPPTIWKNRFAEINNFEAQLHKNGIHVVKFFLHISKKEQAKRFLARIDDPTKNWKFTEADLAERAYWKEYQHAYEDCLRNTSAENAPWYVIPADHKWFARLAVSEILVETVRKIDPQYPNASKAHEKRLRQLRRQLLGKD